MDGNKGKGKGESAPSKQPKVIFSDLSAKNMTDMMTIFWLKVNNDLLYHNRASRTEK